MTDRWRLLLAALAVPAAFATGACAGDDGADVRTLDEGEGSASGSGSGTHASGSGTHAETGSPGEDASGVEETSGT